MQILPVTTAVREAFITGDLSRAEELLTQEIEADATNHISYANFSLIMARKLDWDRALQNAAKVTMTHHTSLKYANYHLDIVPQHKAFFDRIYHQRYGFLRQTECPRRRGSL